VRRYEDLASRVYLTLQEHANFVQSTLDNCGDCVALERLRIRLDALNGMLRNSAAPILPFYVSDTVAANRLGSHLNNDLFRSIDDIRIAFRQRNYTNLLKSAPFVLEVPLCLVC
jgi:hypothetical protein